MLDSTSFFSVWIPDETLSLVVVMSSKAYVTSMTSLVPNL